MPKTPPEHPASPRIGKLADLRRLHKQRRQQHQQQDTARSSITRKAQAVSDHTLFEQAMRHVKPLELSSRHARHPHHAPTSWSMSESLQHRRARAMGESAPAHASLLSDIYHAPAIQHDDSRFVRPGHDPHLARQLRQGKRRPDAWIDLHGFDLNTARMQLDDFIAACLAQRWRCVHIVHGKGLGSPNGEPVLKQAVRRWLTQYDAILAFSECAERDGGAGAVRVLLRKPPKRT